MAIAAPLLAAEASVVPVPETVVTASRLPQNLSDTLQPVTIIDSQDIEDSGQQTLTEVLQRLGGVEITSNGGPGQTSAVLMRGANSSHTLVLIDGLRVNSITSGTTAFENIPLNQIERIEIVPGPLSSLYGSDAIGGVIQIFTKSDTRGAGIAASAGTYDTRSLSGSFSGGANDTSFTLAAGLFDTDAFDATRPEIPFGLHNPDKDGYRNKNLSAKLAHRFNADNTLGVTAFYSNGETDFDSGPATNDVNEQKLTAYSIYSENQITPVWQSLVRIGTGGDEIVTRGALPSRFETDQNQATWQNTFKFSAGSVIAGLEYRREKLDADTDVTTTADPPFGETRRTIRSGFAGYAANFGNHGVQINARRDDYSDFGGRTTGSLGYGYRVNRNLRLRASGGTAFHAPTFNDLFFPFFGNPDLEPERSRSYEAGMDYQVGAHGLAVTAFQNRISDLIVFDLATFLPQNVDEAKIRGIEVSYQGTLLGTQLRAKLNVQDPENENTGFQLQRRAKRFGSIGAARAWGAWRFGADVVASSERFDSFTEEEATRMAGYALLNLFTAWKVSPEWSVDLRWNNVTNKDYELAKFFNTPDSNVTLTLRWAARE